MYSLSASFAPARAQVDRVVLAAAADRRALGLGPPDGLLLVGEAVLSFVTAIPVILPAGRRANTRKRQDSSAGHRRPTTGQAAG